MGVEGATSPFKRTRSGSPRCYSFREKNSRLLLVRSRQKKCGRRGRDESFPMIKRKQRALSNDSGPVLLGTIVSDKKILKEQCFLPLFHLNCYNSAPIGPICTQKIWASAPIGPIWTKNIWAQRARGVLSNDQGSVLLVPFEHLYLGSYWFHLDEKNMVVEGASSPFHGPRSGSPRCYSSGEKNCKRKIFFSLFPLNRYNSAPIGPFCTQKIWA
ncbi:hypothetical protein V1477_006414 [Vespula maculifrons]|uniref:Uncharacterized protein n=1 Tax=Vespula maculifrons TaxID=7453 RepID=A0ABD2CLG4_VESMC